MISQNFIHHYNNWNAKVDSIIGDDLPNVYDRYMTLFVIYNNLYNQVPAALITKGIAIPNQIYDNKAATDLVVQYLGGGQYTFKLTSKRTYWRYTGHNKPY